MVAEEGFEPSQYESESQVLPLHNSALHSRRIAEVLYYYTKKFARCQHLFLRKSTRNKIPLRKICRVPGFGRHGIITSSPPLARPRALRALMRFRARA